MARHTPVPPAATLYVGDRLDNDIIPAAAAGFRTALIRRGPWAYVQPASDVPTIHIDSLLELPAAVAAG